MSLFVAKYLVSYSYSVLIVLSQRLSSSDATGKINAQARQLLFTPDQNKFFTRQRVEKWAPQKKTKMPHCASHFS